MTTLRSPSNANGGENMSDETDIKCSRRDKMKYGIAKDKHRFDSCEEWKADKEE